MRIENFNTDDKVLIIAEIGNNHEGDPSVAKKMIQKAADAGADAVKFQTFNTEHYVGTQNRERYEMLKSFELPGDVYFNLKEVAREEGLVFMSTPFDLESALFLNDIVSVFKIASGDNTFYPLIETVAGLEKPVIMSCGLADYRQVAFAKGFIEKKWQEIQYKGDLGLLHCVTSYPVPDSEANIGAIQELRTLSNVTPGYSDHTLGIEACVLCVAAGARIIEKHFTMDKNYSAFRDHTLSADPEEFKTMVERVRQAERFTGHTGIGLYDCEKEIHKLVRRSIVAARQIEKGEIISQDDITWVRPGGGIPPGSEHLVLGKKTNQMIPKSGQIKTDMLH